MSYEKIESTTGAYDEQAGSISLARSSKVPAAASVVLAVAIVASGIWYSGGLILKGIFE